MGIETIILISAFAIAAALAAYTITQSKKSASSDQMGPQGLDQFGITQNREGSAVPMIYGRVRLPGNIIWYGNLGTDPVYTEFDDGGGGKGFGGGGGGDDQISSYRYYIDIWQSIGMGKLILIDTYVNNQKETVNASNIEFNDGTMTNFPMEPGPDANKIKGIAHIFFKRLFLGENTTVVPTIHFVVERTLNTPVNFQNMTNGSNPAAIIYDIFRKAGLQENELDLNLFNIAATYWNSRGYGLNLVFSSQVKCADMINEVLSQVEGSVFLTTEGKYGIKAFDPNEAPVEILNDDDYFEFSMRRVAYTQLPNDFRGNFIDQDQDYSQRTVVSQNQAVIELTGNRVTQSLDLAAFRDLNTASKRIFEIMKQLSYPDLEIDVRTHLGFSELVPGDVIEINNSDFGITSAEFRVVSIDQSAIESNEVRFKARQVIENLFDDNFLVAGGTEQVPPDTDLDPFTNIRIFELPYNNITGFNPAFLILVARPNLIETGFEVLFSLSPTADFVSRGILTTFSQKGTLSAAYPVNEAIDDATGILYDPVDFDPEFSPISRANLFSEFRVAVIDNEMIAFQDVQAEGPVNYRLKGCIRGIALTPVESHSSGAAIFICNVANNILQSAEASTFYLKLIPRFGNKSLDPSLVSSIQVTVANKAKKPRNPSRLKATRSGSNITLEIWPNSPDVAGAGQGIAENVTDTAPHPFPHTGDFEVSYLSTKTYIQDTTTTIVQAGAVAITVKSRRFGLLSDGLNVNVGAGDGVYKA